jgi:N-acetyl-anhydromuramyl-L-alanine amidase AmpD
MATRHGLVRAARACAGSAGGVALSLGLALGAVGCASNKPQEPPPLMVAALPAPNFDGPDLAEPAPAPVAIPKVKPALPSPAPAIAGVPREWVPQAQANHWQWIVIHHSATATGGAAAFDKEHKAKGWDELGYHFVIGNGTDTRDGQIEVGPRWPRQKWGAHAKTPDNRFNDFGIGICLVGNFDNTRPTAEQMKSLSRLVAYLMRTYRIPAERVVGHGDTGKATDCPGRLMNVAQVRQMSLRALADAGEATPSADTQTAAVQLLHDATH